MFGVHKKPDEHGEYHFNIKIQQNNDISKMLHVYVEPYRTEYINNGGIEVLSSGTVNLYTYGEYVWKFKSISESIDDDKFWNCDDDIDNLKIYVPETEKKLNDMINDYTKLNDKFNQCNDNVKNLEQQNERLKFFDFELDYEKIIQNKDDDIYQLKTNLKSIQNHVDILNDTIHERYEQINKLNSEISKKSRYIFELTENIKNKNKIIKDKNKIITDNEQIIRDNKQIIKNNKQIIKNNEQNIKTLHIDINNVESNYEKYKISHQKLTNELNKQLDNASIETIDLKNIINELIINYKSCKESTLICQTDLKKINQRLIDERDEFLNMIINLQDKLNKKN